MNAQFQLTVPDEAQATLTITASIKEFKMLRELIEQHPNPLHWPLGDLRTAVRAVIANGEKQFTEYSNKQEA